MAEDLDSLVRRTDEDRWLAARLAPAPARARLIALYALAYEIARTAETVREPALGDIRLAWWREALEELDVGAPPRKHPALEAFAQAGPWLRGGLALLIEARATDFEPAPFPTWEALEAYLDATAGSVLRLALHACGGGADDAFIAAAARAWGYAGLMRAAPYWRARGREVLAGDVGEARARGQAAFARARVLAAKLPSDLFPAFGYLAFAPRYLRDPERPALLVLRQLRLTGAAMIGRI